MLTSVHNPKIKYLLSLGKARERKSLGLFVIEGVKELSLAIHARYAIESIFYCPDLVDETTLASIGISPAYRHAVSASVFEKIAYRESTGGVIAIGRQKKHTLQDLQLSKNPLLLILEGVEKPGNLGAMLRTADAAGLDAVIICDPLTDFYNPNVIRSSVGCVFTRQTACANSAETQQWLRQQGIKIFCTYLKGAMPYTRADYRGPCALVMGTESTGLTSTWTDSADGNIIIPMQGVIDSMNVSVAAAVVVFEALRQRQVGR